jgi:hypothetical protein
MSALAMPRRTDVHSPEPAFDRWDLLAILGVLLLFLLAAHAPVATKPFGDLDFDIEARHLVAALSGTGPWPAVDIVRAPGPVLYYVLPYLPVNGASGRAHWIAACIWNACWCAVALLLMRRAAAAIAGPVAGRVALAAAFALPFWAYYGCGVNGEVPAFAGVAAFCFGWSHYLESDDRACRKYGLVAVLGASAFLLTKPAALLLLPVGALAVVRLRRHRGATERRAARFSLRLLVAALAVFVLSSAALKMIAARRAATAQEQYFYWTAFFGSFQFRNEPWDWRFWGDKTRQGSADYDAFRAEHSRLKERSATTGVPLVRLEKEWVLNDVRQHFFLRLRATAVRALSMNLPIANSVSAAAFRMGPLRGWWGYVAFHAVVFAISLLLLGGALLFLAGSRDSILFYWWLWGPWLALLLFHSATYAEPRYLFPGQPGLIVMAAVTFGMFYSAAHPAAPLSTWRQDH